MQMVRKCAHKLLSYDSVTCTASALEILSPKSGDFCIFIAKMSLELWKLSPNTPKTYNFLKENLLSTTKITEMAHGGIPASLEN